MMTAHNPQHVQHAQHAQHSQSHTQTQRNNHARREPRSFDSTTHHRIGNDNRRFRDGHEDICFEGYWFTRFYDSWPEWVFTEDVYFVMGPNDVWFVYQYQNPAYILQVTLVD
jgi:hypothetical protein